MVAVASPPITLHPRLADAQRTYQPRGAALDLFYSKVPQVVVSGPAGTGKSRACLEKLYLCAAKYQGMRALIVRKTRESLTQSAMVTFEQKVLPARTPVSFHGQDNEYRFPNGSVIVVGGLDKAAKVMSAEYDMAYVQEATELTENDWESLTTRLRNGVMPYQQLLADCNPDAPTHWLKRRVDNGLTLMLQSRHEDNPTVTPEYLAKLDALTGVRKERLRWGKWVSAEGIVYEGWDSTVHMIDPFPMPEEWARYRVIDFGFVNPFVCQWWAEDSDGRLYRYRELYQTNLLTHDAADEINRLSEGERYQWTAADHDASERATLHSKGINTRAAHKDVAGGIQTVQERLSKAKDGKPRLFLMRGALVRRDPLLVEKKMPTCTEEEIDGYVWAKGNSGQPAKEIPVKENDHGLDAMRYMVYTLGSRKSGGFA